MKIIKNYDFMSVVMYPELRNRREFIHDAWCIAQGTSNTELMYAISADDFFYMTREDCLELLRSESHEMIAHLLRNDVMLQIKEDISYKLIQIKRVQVDKNQMSTLRLIDFLSVMLSNKREDTTDFNSKVTFNHKAILNFLKIHDEFVLQDEVVKIFVLARRFRLSL